VTGVQTCALPICIGFGTDVTWYRSGASLLSLLTNSVQTISIGNNGANSVFSFHTNTGKIINISELQATFNTPLILGGNGGGNEDLIFRTGGTGQILLGTSGPSLTAKLAGDASCQGLITDGSTTSSASGVPAFGTGDYTAHMVVRATTATAPNMFMRNGQIGVSTAWIIGTTDAAPAGRLNVRNGDASAQLFGNTVLQSGVNYTVTVVRSSGTVTFYLNGVANGSGTLATNYTDTTTGFSLMPTAAGFIGKPLVYNRALSAAEVKALYESGTPATADYNNASNTALNTSSWADVSGSTFSSASGATFTVSRAVGTSYVAMRPSPSPVWKNFTKFLITGTLTLNAGKTVLPYVYVDGTGATQLPITAAGSFSVVVTTPAGGGTVNGVVFTATGDQNYTVSSVSVTPLGVLLAPDAKQAGGGLAWYDTSGNGRTITLPATGVSWNVVTGGQITLRDGTAAAPAMSFANQADMGFYKISSAVLGLAVSGAVQLRFDPTGSIYGGGAGINNIVQLAPTGAINLIAAGTNQNITLTPSGTGTVQALPGDTRHGLSKIYTLSTGDAFGFEQVNTVQNDGVYAALRVFTPNSTNGRFIIGRYTTSTNYVREFTFNQNGNLLIGTDVDSTNGKIQLATGTTAALGIGFGTEISLFRAASTQLTVTVSTIEVASFIRNGSGTAFQVNGGSLTQPTIHVNGDSNTGLFFELGDTLSVVTGGTRAISFDGSQNATFTGTAITAASATGKAGLRLPHGAAPTAPVNGDIWTTTAGLYVRINGATVGPLT